MTGVREVVFDGRESWLNWRLGKATGSILKDLISARGDGVKTAIYRLAAESLIGPAAIAEADLSAMEVMERGHELEGPAIRRFQEETGKKVSHKLVGWESLDDPRMAVSPDGVIGKTQAVEVKCLLAAKHMEAFHTKAIPKNTGGYEEQAAQYFIVNGMLRTLYYVFYHPDFPAGMDFFYLTFTRKEMKDEIARLEALERAAVAKVREIVNAASLYSAEDLEKLKARREELAEPVTTESV